MNPIIAGGLINCALYLALVGLAGISDGNRLAVMAAVLSAGVATLGYMAQMYDGTAWRTVAWVLYIASQASAVLAGVLLAVGYFG